MLRLIMIEPGPHLRGFASRILVPRHVNSSLVVTFSWDQIFGEQIGGEPSELLKKLEVCHRDLYNALAGVVDICAQGDSFNLHIWKNVNRIVRKKVEPEAADAISDVYWQSINNIDLEVFQKFLNATFKSTDQRTTPRVKKDKASECLMKLKKCVAVLRITHKSDIEGLIEEYHEPSVVGPMATKYEEWIEGLKKVAADINQQLDALDKDIAAKMSQYDFKPPAKAK